MKSLHCVKGRARETNCVVGALVFALYLQVGLSQTVGESDYTKTCRKPPE